MNESIFILQGDIIYTKEAGKFEICENGYLVCEQGKVKGVYRTLPFTLGGIPVKDYKGKLLIPGLVAVSYTHLINAVSLCIRYQNRY